MNPTTINAWPFGNTAAEHPQLFGKFFSAVPPADIGWAVTAMRTGHKVRRRGWNGAASGMYIYYVEGSTFVVNHPPLLGMFPVGTRVEYMPHIDMRTAQGTFVPWLASQTDLLATDWELA